MRIAVISDTHVAPHARAFNANARAAAAWIARERPDLIVHLGDVTADGVADPAHLAHARGLFAAPAAPLLATPGNHDVGDCPPGGGGEPPLDLDALARFRAAFGPDRWTRLLGGWRLVGLDAQLLGTGGAEEAAQDAWLRGVLARDAAPLALFLHKPLCLHDPDEAPDHPRYAPRAARLRLLAAAVPGRLGLVVSGHAHQSRLARIDGALHAWAPSTAFVIPEPLQPVIGDKRCGVLRITLADGEARVETVVPEGLAQLDLLDRADVYPQVAALRPAP